MKDAKHIHLIGICGTAMASLAGLLQTRGHRVTGSDTAAYPPMSDFLLSLGIQVAQPFSAQESRPRPRYGRSRQRRLPRQCRTGTRSRQPHPLLLPPTNPAPRVPPGQGSPRHRRHPRQNHHHLHALVDLPLLRPQPIVPHRRHRRKLRQQLRRRFRPRTSSSKATNTTLPSSTRAPSSSTTFRRAPSSPRVEFDHADIYDDLKAVETAFKRLVNLAAAHAANSSPTTPAKA